MGSLSRKQSPSLPGLLTLIQYHLVPPARLAHFWSQCYVSPCYTACSLRQEYYFWISVTRQNWHSALHERVQWTHPISETRHLESLEQPRAQLWALLPCRSNVSVDGGDTFEQLWWWQGWQTQLGRWGQLQTQSKEQSAGGQTYCLLAVECYSQSDREPSLPFCLPSLFHHLSHAGGTDLGLACPYLPCLMDLDAGRGPSVMLYP